MRGKRTSEWGVDAPADAAAIQPHAMLLVLDPGGNRIEGASANAASWLDRDPAAGLAGAHPEDLLDADSLARLRRALAAGALEHPASVDAVLRADGALLGFGLVHRVAGHPLLEIEAPVEDETQEAVPAAWLDCLSADGPRIGPDEEIDIVAELAAVADRLLEATGFDRVSVHRFVHEGNIELLAESCRPSAPRLAGRVFASDDMPSLWNPMYGMYWVRTVADLDAGSIPVELPDPLAGDPLALRNVFARAPLASHEAYLRALGVRSTTVLTLSDAGKPWGMIACHAMDTPRRISVPRRIALTALARGLSHRITAHEGAARRGRLERIRERLATPFAALGSGEEFVPPLSQHAAALMEGLSATGMAICVGSTIECHGRTPPDTIIRELAQWLTAGQPPVFASDRLGSLFAPVASHGDTAAGMLAIRLSRVSADFVMWFRPQAPRMLRDPVPVVAPGASPGDAGTARVRSGSTPWSSDERAAAGELRRAVLDILVERSVRVSRRAMMLTRDNQALVSADQRKDAFIAMLGHELREPLAAFEYGIASIEGACREGSMPPRELLDILRRQARQMGALVEDIVDIARIRNNRLELRRRPLRVADVLRDALDANAGALERANQGIEMDCADDEMWIMADPMRMMQVLTNLLGNAIRHARSSRPIELVARRDGQQAVISVRDHGPGLSRKTQRTIFDAFSAPVTDAESSRTGLGLGLWLVRNLVEAHAGRIEVASEGKGSGCCFTLRLPLIDAGPAPEPAHLHVASTPAEAPNTPRRVLVVDDDADTAVVLAMLLRTYGHNARKAHDGATALAVLASYEADVVTIDQNLPDTDGVSLAREIRARTERPIRLLCISGAAPDEGFGADVFDQVLVKPVDPMRLLAVIARQDAVDPGTG